MWRIKSDSIFYTDTCEMPMNKFNDFMNHFILDSHVGGEVKDFVDHIKKVYSFVEAGKKDHAKQQLHNMFQCLHNVKTNNHPKKEALKFLLKKNVNLDSIPYQTLINTYEEVKKNFLNSLS